MEKIWLKHYPAGIPSEIHPEQYHSLAELLLEACQRYATLPALSSFNHTITYAQLERASLAFATYCQQQLHLKKGERIALMLPNCLQYPIALLGALRAGLVVVNVNPLYTAHELRHQLKDAGTKAIVIIENFATVLETALADCQPHHVITTEIGDCLPALRAWVINFVTRRIKKLIPAWSIPNTISFKNVLKVGQQQTFVPVPMSLDDVAFLQYTGGTTGIAKGAMLSHKNMVANVLQAVAWVTPFTKEKQEIIITALPLYHIFSLTANLLTFTMRGGLNVLITNPRDMKLLIHLIKKIKFTAITGVNTLFNGLLHQDEFSHCDFSHLHLTLGGGMAVQNAVAQRWQAVTGVALAQAYGLTETSPAVCINPLNLKSYSNTVGMPVPSTDIRVCDDDGQEVELGKAGELWVRGPQVMKGYWNNPAETAKVMVQDWLKTGDIVTVDAQGYVSIVDRKKDMIIVSGFNVYPNEVEDVIAACPGVAEVGVVGVVNSEHGELVKAYIVRRDPQLTEEQVIRYCHDNLTPYKVPKIIQFCNVLPKSPVGKILRRELRDQPTVTA